MRLEILNNFNFIKQGDTKSEFKFKLLDYDDIPIDLTDKTVTVVIANSTVTILQKTPLVNPEETGVISFSFNNEDVTGYGDMRLEVHIKDDAGDTLIIPSKGYYKFVIEKSLSDITGGISSITLKYFEDRFDARIAQMESAINETQNAKFAADQAAEEANAAATNATEKATELESRMDNKTAEIEERVNQAIAAGTQDLEVKDARAGHVNLKARLDSTDTQLAQVAQEEYKIYGVFWDKSSKPVLTRTNDAQGLIANVGVDNQYVDNDFDNAQIYREIGEVTDEFGNVFVRIPKFYIKKTSGPGFYSIQITKAKLPGYYLPWCFWDFVHNKELDYIDVGKYKASLSVDNKLESKPDVPPLISRNIVQFRDYARANGAGYQQLDLHVYDVIQTLFTVEFATLNCQSVMQGFVSGRYTTSDLATVAEMETNRIIVANATADLYRVGQNISVGTSQGGNQIFYGRTITSIDVYDDSNKAIVFDGDPVDIAVGNYLYNTGWKNGFSRSVAASSGSIGNNTDGKYPCSYRGIESPWGDVWQFVDGVNINNNQAWVCKDASQYASNVFATPYEQLGYVNCNENGYVREMGYDQNHPYAQFPVAVGGGASSYYSDNYYQSSGARIARVGGHWYIGVGAGLWCWALSNASSDADVYVGGRLLKKAS